MTDRDAIFVTGATGTVGRPVVAHLITAGFDVWAATRVPGLVGGQMPAVRIDWDDASTYRPYLRATHTLVLIMPIMTDRVDRMLGLIEAATDLGVTRIIKVSTIGSTAAISKIDQSHRTIDEHLEATAVDTTLIRVAPVMQEWLSHHPVDGTYEGVSATALPYIDARDLASCITHRIGAPSDQTLTLTGSVSHTPQAMVAIIGDVLGRPTRYRRIDGSELWTRLADQGVPAATADQLVEHHRATETLARIEPTSDFANVLGRRPTGFTEFVADHRAVFDANRRS